MYLFTECGGQYYITESYSVEVMFEALLVQETEVHPLSQPTVRLIGFQLRPLYDKQAGEGRRQDLTAFQILVTPFYGFPGI